MFGVCEKCGEGRDGSITEVMHQLPALRKKAPAWSGVAVLDKEFRNISSKDYEGKYLVLLFYPFDFTFVCPVELIQFGDRIEEFRSSGTEIVAVSTDSEFSHFAWATTPRKQGGLGDIKIPLLSDKSHRISRAYGVLDEEKGVPFKGLFIADCKQVLRHMAVHDVSIPRSVDEVLRLVNACQYVDKYGDVCPAGLSKNAEKRPQTESKCGAPGKISEYFAVC